MSNLSKMFQEVKNDYATLWSDTKNNFKNNKKYMFCSALLMAGGFIGGAELMKNGYLIEGVTTALAGQVTGLSTLGFMPRHQKDADGPSI